MTSLAFAEPIDPPEPDLEIIDDSPPSVDDHADDAALARWEDDGGAVGRLVEW